MRRFPGSWFPGLGFGSVRDRFRGGNRFDPRLDLLNQGPPSSRSQRWRGHATLWRPTPGSSRWSGSLRLGVTQDDFARLGKAFARQNGLDDAGVDPRILFIDSNTDRLQLEQEILLGNPHLAGQILNPNFPHRDCDLLGS